MRALLLGFFVFHVLAARFAIFFDLDAIGIVSLILHRRVIAAFALAARQRDDDSVVLLSHRKLLSL